MKRLQPEIEILSRLDSVLAYDVLTDAYTEGEVADLIYEAGGDAEMIGKRGEALVVSLMEQLRRSSRKENRSDGDKPKSEL